MDEKPDSPRTLVDVPAHCIYAGVTQTGKTTLARLHARLLSENGYDVCVYDPVHTATAGGDWPSNAQVFDNQAQFIAYVKSAQDVFVFVDESADVFSLSQTENHWLLRRGRHQGLYVRLIVQRPKMIAPNVRTQCAVAYVFRMARDDATELFADFGHSRAYVREYVDALDVGDFVVLESGRPQIAAFNVFDLTHRKGQ
jgi:DNA helicase HerA-like ATPase